MYGTAEKQMLYTKLNSRDAVYLYNLPLNDQAHD